MFRYWESCSPKLTGAGATSGLIDCSGEARVAQRSIIDLWAQRGVF
jgi:hypothetical protein